MAAFYAVSEMLSDRKSQTTGMYHPIMPQIVSLLTDQITHLIAFNTSSTKLTNLLLHHNHQNAAIRTHSHNSHNLQPAPSPASPPAPPPSSPPASPASPSFSIRYLTNLYQRPTPCTPPPRQQQYQLSAPSSQQSRPTPQSTPLLTPLQKKTKTQQQR